MSETRPDPDELLARVQAEDAVARRGRLKIFFGYAAGVGKTYSMLQAARREVADKIDVVVGYVEPHGRAETEALLNGLECIPFLHVPYHGVTVREFDLDAALARHPKLILVDELAHTNADGARHSKRWQDVEELLDAGIDVYTTLNVQHVESLNDVIAQITGVVVRETLPDALLERADEIELIDITPEELTQRLLEGKIYLAPQAERALENFFQKSNLVALREISLRQTAQRLSRDVEAARQAKDITAPWATNERLLVCVGPSPTTARLIRSAKRMAAAFGAEWLAISVANPQAIASTTVREHIASHLQLADELGAETHTLIGTNIAETLLEFARARNVTKIVVGKTAQPLWRRVLIGGVVEELLEHSGEIDIYVIRGEDEAVASPRRTPQERRRADRGNWAEYLKTIGIVAASGLLSEVLRRCGLAEANIVMVFLLGVAVVAARFGSGPSIIAAIAAVLVFDFFFVPPRLTFAVADAQYVLTFGVMLVIGLMISSLTHRIRQQLAIAKDQGRRTADLFHLTRQLSELVGSEFLVLTAGRQLETLFDGEVVVFLSHPGGPVKLRYGEPSTIAAVPVNAVVAEWVAEHSQVAGYGTDTLPNATALFVPLVGTQQCFGAIGVRPTDADRFLDPEQRRLLETCASLVALAIERDHSVLEAHEALLKVKTEQLRNSLLSSVSHDLRTPLATIAGAASSLRVDRHRFSDSACDELLQCIVEESQRFTRLIDNLLDMTRLESGGVTIKREWNVLEEIVGSALARTREQLKQHRVTTNLPADLPLVNVDGVLFEQVFVNLLENAARYTPPGSNIEVSAAIESASSSSRFVQGRHAASNELRDARRIELRVTDNGPGLPAGDPQRLFEKFVRGEASSPDGRRGVGLGLAICRAIVEAHGGNIVARNRSSGGAEFVISLPITEPPVTILTDS